MIVRCSRCQNEYDLDTALLSERGATVECTSCGFRFRVLAGGQTPLEAHVASEAIPKTRPEGGLEPLYPSPQAGAAQTPVATGEPPPLSTYFAAPYGGVAVRYDSFRDSSADIESGSLSRRGVRSRWIAALVVLGSLGLLAGTVGRRYLAQFAAHEPIEAQDPNRLLSMVHQGERLFYDDDLEGAKAEFDKATVLSENDPVALSFLARIEAVRADMMWLRLRFASDKDQSEPLRQTFAARLKKLDAAVTAAVAAAKDDAGVVRAQVDALRLEGKLNEARALAPRLSSSTQDPETEYVLAALDIADVVPSWLSVIERLHSAAVIEHGFGRARAALVYALIGADRIADARAELTRDPPDPTQLSLFTAAEAYLNQKAGNPPPAPPSAAPSPSAVPVAAEAQPAVAANPIASDAPKQLEDAAARARAKGDTEQAKRLYEQALDRNPNDIDALTNLGELAKERRDFGAAMQYFESVERMNASYLPALMGVADIRWLEGEKSQAVELYQRVLDGAGSSSSYGAHARVRIDEYRLHGAPASEESKPHDPLPPSSAVAPHDEAPAIDTSDLPELHR